MNRITIATVFAFLAAVGSTGCFAQSTTTTTEGSGTYEQTAPSDDPSEPTEAEQIAAANGQPIQTLELEFAPSNPPAEQQGPFPEPWIRVMGPFPEPWNGKTAEPSGSGNNGNDPNKP